MSPTLKFKHAGVFTTTGGSGGSEPEIVIGPYVRPADWLTLPAVNEGDQKFVGLHAVYDHESNFVAVNCAGAYTVDWGDGTAPENLAANAQANHNYVYSALGSGTLSTLGYRQAIVTITPQAGQNFTKIDLGVKHSQSGLANGYTAGWLDIRVAGSNISSLVIQSTTPTARLLEQFEFVGTNVITSFNNMFNGCWSLQSVPLFDTSLSTTFSNMFNGCQSLQSVPPFDTSMGNAFSSMFGSCQSLQSVPPFDTSMGNAFNGMFNGCWSLREVPLFDTAAGTNFSHMFNGCWSLREVPLFDTAAGTNFTQMFISCRSLQSVPLLNTVAGLTFDNMFNGCWALQTVPALNTSGGTNFSGMFSGCSSLAAGALAGISKTISYANCSLGPAALDAIYANLASGVTAQTITVTGNWGNASDDPSIATAKGWTVTG